MHRATTLTVDITNRKIKKEKVRVHGPSLLWIPGMGPERRGVAREKQVRREEKCQHPEQEGEKRQPKAHAVLPYMKGLKGDSNELT